MFSRLDFTLLFSPVIIWLGKLLMLKNANVISQDIAKRWYWEFFVLGWLYVTLFVAEIIWHRRITNTSLHQSRKHAFVQIYIMGTFVFKILRNNSLLWKYVILKYRQNQSKKERKKHGKHYEEFKTSQMSPKRNSCVWKGHSAN